MFINVRKVLTLYDIYNWRPSWKSYEIWSLIRGKDDNTQGEHGFLFNKALKENPNEEVCKRNLFEALSSCSDNTALRLCILNDVISQNSIEFSYKQLSNVMGRKLKYPTFEKWYNLYKERFPVLETKIQLGFLKNEKVEEEKLEEQLQTDNKELEKEQLEPKEQKEQKSEVIDFEREQLEQGRQLSTEEPNVPPILANKDNKEFVEYWSPELEIHPIPLPPLITVSAAHGGTVIKKLKNFERHRLMFKISTNNEEQYYMNRNYGFIEPFGFLIFPIFRRKGLPGEDKIFVKYAKAFDYATDARDAFFGVEPDGVITVTVVAD